MNKKPLVIEVQRKSVPSGDLFKWSSLTEQMPTFTRDIITPAIAIDKDGNSASNIGAIVSGMPTIYARANLFKLALNYRPDKDSGTDGLMNYYKQLIDEWRGLLACIALDYSRVEIERIHLKYSDGASISKTSNIYEPKGAFGNLLFDRKPLWCNQELAPNEEKVPFIDVIKYQDQVVGATSPDSFLFSSVAYDITENLPFVANGKFTDPLKAHLSESDIKSLYAYIEYVLKNVENFRRYFDNVPENIKPQYQSISGNLEDWKKDIEKYAQKRNVKLEDASIPQIDKFDKPFSILFNYSDKLYGLNGIIFESTEQSTLEFDPRELLLPKNSEIARIDFGNEVARNPKLLAEQPIFVLKAECKGVPNYSQYFALPLSPLGLNVFGKNIQAIIGMNDNTNIQSRMTAEYDPTTEINNLSVTLTLKTQTGKQKVLVESYTVGTESIIQNNDILIWPNFISKQWNRYFMYSELPHNESTSPFQATPFVGDVSDENFRIHMDREGKEALRLAEGGKISIPETYTDIIKAKLHISSDKRIADNRYKYEIYESNLPFKGVRLNRQGKESGYLVIRYSSAENGLPRDYLGTNRTLYNANLGIDFGSTNTSIAYYSKKPDNNRIVDQIKLKNRRVSLLSLIDKNRNNEKPAMENEIFFFQDEEVKTNAIKSVLAIHDQKRVTREDVTTPLNSLLGQSVRGGFPCFEKNLPIQLVSENRYKLQYSRAGIVEMVYNMKWSTDDTEKAHKQAYLSSLLLHVYAQLFEENHFPQNLKWSYPSSMGKSLLGQYYQIWSALKTVNPLVSDGDEAKYNLHVCDPDVSLTIERDANTFESKNTDDVWGSTSESSSWGNSFSSSSWDSTDNQEQKTENGWDEPSKKVSFNDISIEQGPIKFNFEQLRDDTALTEACSVANYIANQQKVGTDINNLILCFDVGGSTTDISALCNMRDKTGATGLAMIKQNSIRFAAQRLSFATKHTPTFKAALLKMCEKKKLKLQGLNVAPIVFSAETAPYYFEQLIDHLDDADFPDFYRLIQAECPELMTVNIYVTGLILFYAGQLSHKLLQEIKKSEDRHPHMNENWKPQVNIVFAGKGARIFDWFKAVNEKTAKDYFTQLFIEGFGGMETARNTLSGPPQINPTGSSDVKYEVSKGLAFPSQTLLVPNNNQAIEILGEDGFVLIGPSGEQDRIPYDKSITPEMMESIGLQFLNMPEPGKPSCQKFMAFASIFYQVATSLFGLKMTKDEFMDAFKNMNINQYIKTLPEHNEARERKRNNKSDTFDFIAPIIVLEGMKFYDEYLLKGISKK